MGGCLGSEQGRLETFRFEYIYEMGANRLQNFNVACKTNLEEWRTFV